jgi:hypothetical protein
VALFSILSEFGVPLKMFRLMKLCRNEAYSRVRIGKHLSDIFPSKNGLKQGDTLSPLLFKIALDYTCMSFQVNQDGLKFNGAYQLWFMLMILILIFWVDLYIL